MNKASEPKLKIKYAKTGLLVPYADNARTHSDEQIAQIAASIEEFGFTNPVLIDEDGGIIAGHGRVRAAEQLGMKTIPTILLEGLDETQRKAYVLADNQLALNAGWDEDLLKTELISLDAEDFDLTILGFDELQLVNFLAGTTDGLTGEDDVPEAPETAVTKLGDIWLLGSHRLMCGDSTDAENVAELMDGAKPHLMVTDPPYGVGYDPDWRNKAKRPDGKPYGANAIGEVDNDDRSDWRAAWELSPSDVVYCWSPSGGNQFDFHKALVDAGFEIRMQIIWAKQHFPIGRGNYHVQHEPCLYAVRKGKTAHWNGSRKETTLWQIANTSAFGGEQDDARTNHSTQKPVECMRRPIVNNSKKGEAIYDPFLGSGTTMISAETEGRVCYGMELDPIYCDMAVERWENFTGLKAINASTEKLFAARP